MVIKKNINIGNELGCKCDLHFQKCIDILKKYIQSMDLRSIKSINEFRSFICEIESNRMIAKDKHYNSSFYKAFGGCYGEENVDSLIRFCEKVKCDDFDNFFELIGIIDKTPEDTLFSLKAPDITETTPTFFNSNDLQYYYSINFEINFCKPVSGVLSADCESELSSLFRSCYFKEISNAIRSSGLGYPIDKIFKKFIKDINYHLFGNEIYEFEIGFSFTEGNLVAFEDGTDKRNSTLYIGDIFKLDSDSSRLNLDKELKRYIFCDGSSFNDFYKLSLEKANLMLKDLIAKVIDINWPGYDVSNIEKTRVPLCLFTDTQLKSTLEKSKDKFPISLVSQVRKQEVDEQFDRFIKILSQI